LPVLQRSNSRPQSRASSRYTSATLASLIHSRALRPVSPARSPRNLLVRPRSRSLPVNLDAQSLDKKRFRRLTLANTLNVSRALFGENSDHERATDASQDLEDKVQSNKSSRIDEMKTPIFGSTPEEPRVLPLSLSEEKNGSTAFESTMAEKDNNELLTTTRFDILKGFADLPPRFVGVDIDDTLVMTNHSPSFLLTGGGVAAFQQFVHKKFSDFKTKNLLCRELEKAVKDKVLVEPGIPSVIRDLQDSGCWVFGVTARYHEMAVGTHKCLTALGINFALTAPFPSQMLRDPKTGTVSVNGIIYCDGLSKGMVLNRFFENVVLRGALANKGNPSPVSASNSSVSSSSSLTPTGSICSSTQSSIKLPEQFVFIDDQKSQAECILKELTCARTLKIPVLCYHYTPPAIRDPCETMNKRQCGQILMKQMVHFIEKKIVLSNQEALHLLRNPSSPVVAPSPSPPSPVISPSPSPSPSPTVKVVVGRVGNDVLSTSSPKVTGRVTSHGHAGTSGWTSSANSGGGGGGGVSPQSTGEQGRKDITSSKSVWSDSTLVSKLVNSPKQEMKALKAATRG